MWRRPVLECLQEKSKAGASFFFGESERTEDLALNILAVNTDGSRAKLCAVQDHVISKRPHSACGFVFARLMVAGNDHDQVIVLSAAFFANRRSSLGEAFFKTLEIFKQLGAAFRDKKRFDVVALFARKLSNFWNANRHHRQVWTYSQRCEILRRECFSNIGHRGKAHIWLITAV